MKVILIFIILTGCYVLPELPDWEIPKNFASLEEALNYVKCFKYSDESTDDWNTPEETYKRGWGDCADLSLLLTHILVVKLNIDNTKVIWGYFEDDYHSWVSINNVWYEPQLGIPITTENYYQTSMYDYRSALRMAERV